MRKFIVTLQTIRIVDSAEEAIDQVFKDIKKIEWRNISSFPEEH